MTSGNESVYLTDKFWTHFIEIKIDAEYGPNGFGLCALSCKVVISHIKWNACLRLEVGAIINGPFG